jgi:nicotinamidase-related amidase
VELTLDAKKTALVVIDLQRGILAGPAAPYSVPEVVGRAAALCRAARDAGTTVVLVRVTPSADGGDALRPLTDQAPLSASQPPADWAELTPELDRQAADVVITKRQWGAFYGTELDLQLRRRGVDTIVLCGISANIGVESTARDAYERAYNLIVVEDAIAARTAEEHAFVMKTVFPRIGRVRNTSEVLAALGG